MEYLKHMQDAERASYRQAALTQACHDDRGMKPQAETLARAESYYEFLVGSKPKTKSEIGKDGPIGAPSDMTFFDAVTIARRALALWAGHTAAEVTVAQAEGAYFVLAEKHATTKDA